MAVFPVTASAKTVVNNGFTIDLSDDGAELSITGDDTHLGLWSSMMILSLLGLIMIK